MVVNDKREERGGSRSVKPAVPQPLAGGIEFVPHRPGAVRVARRVDDRLAEETCGSDDAAIIRGPGEQAKVGCAPQLGDLLARNLSSEAPGTTTRTEP